MEEHLFKDYKHRLNALDEDIRKLYRLRKIIETIRTRRSKIEEKASEL